MEGMVPSARPAFALLLIAGCASPISSGGPRDMAHVEYDASGPCRADEECPPGYLCKMGRCTPGCNAQHGCGPRGECNAMTGQCDECENDRDCKAPRPRCD